MPDNAANEPMDERGILWRSLLYTPGNQPKIAEKAARTAADVVILDLEDSVLPADKELARKLIAQGAQRVASKCKSVGVRVNSDWSIQEKDLHAAVAADAHIVVLPKVENPDQVVCAADFLSRIENSGAETALIVLIETPLGLQEVDSIAKAHPRVKAINLGTEDFAQEMRMEPEEDGLLYPSQMVAVAARAAGIVPLGYIGSIAGFRDTAQFACILARSARLGFEGGFAIHPSQIDPLNTAFSPNDEEIALAEEVVSKFEEAKQRGQGAVLVRGRMVDLPVAVRAKEKLVRAALCFSRERG